MRALETLLLLAEALTLLVLSVPRWRGAPWMRHSATVAVLVGATQILVEGPRWQMMPAYALAVLLCLLSVLSNSATAGEAARRRCMASLFGLGLPWFVLSIGLPVLVPVFRFPTPTGPYALGTLTYPWLDPTRHEAFTSDAEARRELMVQVWYPAAASPMARRAAYLPDASAVTAAFARIHGQLAFAFGHFKYVTSNAVPSAPAASD